MHESDSGSVQLTVETTGSSKLNTDIQPLKDFTETHTEFVELMWFGIRSDKHQTVDMYGRLEVKSALAFNGPYRPPIISIDRGIVAHGQVCRLKGCMLG